MSMGDVEVGLEITIFKHGRRASGCYGLFVAITLLFSYLYVMLHVLPLPFSRTIVRTSTGNLPAMTKIV